MKNLARILALALVVIMTLSLVGCGTASKFKGEWAGEILGMEFTMEFGKDELTTTISYMGEEESNTVDYEVKGDKLYIDDEEVEYEFDGRKTLILEIEDGMEIELEKQ